MREKILWNSLIKFFPSYFSIFACTCSDEISLLIWKTFVHVLYLSFFLLSNLISFRKQNTTMLANLFLMMNSLDSLKLRISLEYIIYLGWGITLSNVSWHVMLMCHDYFTLNDDEDHQHVGFALNTCATIKH